MRISWTDLATTDLDHIEQYIAEQNSSAVAVGVVLRILGIVEAVLPEHPEAGRSGRVNGTRELVIHGVPFVLIYRREVSRGSIEILRVLHDSQQWPPSPRL